MQFLITAALASLPKKLGSSGEVGQRERSRVVDAKDDEGITALMKGRE